MKMVKGQTYIYSPKTIDIHSYFKDKSTAIKLTKAYSICDWNFKLMGGAEWPMGTTVTITGSQAIRYYI